MIGTNGELTSVCLFYPEDLIEWTTGDSDGGSGGLGGNPASVGLVAEDQAASYFFNISGTNEVVEIESTGNLGVNGLWVFRVDGPNIIFPGALLLLFLCCCIVVVVVVVAAVVAAAAAAVVVVVVVVAAAAAVAATIA